MDGNDGDVDRIVGGRFDRRGGVLYEDVVGKAS